MSEEGGPDYPVIMGDYAAEEARWESRPITPGTPLQRPSPLFPKLDESLGKTGPELGPHRALTSQPTCQRLRVL